MYTWHSYKVTAKMAGQVLCRVILKAFKYRADLQAAGI